MTVATSRIAHSAPNLSRILVGASPAMQEVFGLIERVAPTDAGILLSGESGSGKELVARAIHEASCRNQGPFVVVNCGAFPAGLIEAELFGYEKGSAAQRSGKHAGAFERAAGGTLLLDDFTQLPTDIQVRLLRVLERHSYYRVGANTELPSDVRVIAATIRHPLEAVQSGQLREDLLYRLAVFPIELPPLRARAGDAELLADHFLAERNRSSRTQKRFTALARSTLKQHSWPGNVRELKNCVDRAFILSDQWLDLSPLIEADTPSPKQRDRERIDIRVGARIHDMERSLIEATLDHFQGNKRRAADALGCSLKTLYNKLNGYAEARASAYARSRVGAYSQSRECARS